MFDYHEGMSSVGTLLEQREILAAAREVLAGLGSVVFQAGGEELGSLLEEVDALSTAAGGARCEVVLEATRRGEVSESGKNTREGVIAHAPSLRQGGAGQLAKIVDAVAARTSLVAGQDEELFTDPDSPIAMIWARTRTGEVTPPLALAALSEMDRLGDRVMPNWVSTVTRAMIDTGVLHGRATMSELRMRLLAGYGRPDEVDDDQKRLATHAFLSAPSVESGNLTRYTMGLTPEQAAILEAALGPLAKPQPNPVTGERDLRPNGQRRAEALTELATRAASADAAGRGGPAESTTTVFVTIPLQSLQQHTGAGEVCGSAATGTLLGPETLRKMCCDADLIPTVLGTDTQPLDHGRVVRLFTRAQRRAIWRRDKTCTYPGCGAPGAWTRVHNVHHWADGGRTDLDNAALLCQRHHTRVHDKRLWAHISPTPDDAGSYVHWDLTPGSYDHHLAHTNGTTPRRTG